MIALVRVRDRLDDLGPAAVAAVSFLLGALATAVMAPAFIVVLLLPAFTGLYWLIARRPGPRSAFWVGYAFGFGFFLVGLYWIGFAFLVYPDRFGWMAPFAVAGLAAILAVYPGLVAMATRIAIARTGSDVSGVVAFAALWVLGEWVRGVAFTGFPWNPVGMAFAFSDALIQPASLFGVYGLSFIAVLAATAPAALSAPDRGGVRLLSSTLLLVVACWGFGQWRLTGAVEANVPGVMLRLVQPNIDQKQKWHPSLRLAHVTKQVEMSRLPPLSATPPTHVIWAETATPFYLAADVERLALVARAVPAGGLLITGAPRAVRVENPPPGEGPVRVWNSLHAIDAEGRVRATYDKAHLVPFGEYIPLRAFLSRFFEVSKITAGSTDFSAGPGPLALALDGLPSASPLICYEGIFPGRVTPPDATQRPGWLLNVTNDGWYRRSAGPHQHFHQVRLRAVEEGLPMVRVANTGISGITDGYGRVRVRLALGVEGALDHPLPRALAPTVYSRFGNGPVLFLLFVLALFAFHRRAR